MSSDAMLDDWALLRESGVSVREAAPRIGVTHAALEKCLERALNRGDSRGARKRKPPKGAPLAFPIDDYEFDWSWRQDDGGYWDWPCETCGAPSGAYCTTRWRNPLHKGHSARRSAARTPQEAAA
jgi:hypothetical protein